jgi:uncharacterized protein (UPF0210 family)
MAMQAVCQMGLDMAMGTVRQMSRHDNENDILQDYAIVSTVKSILVVVRVYHIIKYNN